MSVVTLEVMRAILVLLALVCGCGDHCDSFTKKETCIVVVLTDAGVDAQ